MSAHSFSLCSLILFIRVTCAYRNTSHFLLHKSLKILFAIFKSEQLIKCFMWKKNLDTNLNFLPDSTYVIPDEILWYQTIFIAYLYEPH